MRWRIFSKGPLLSRVFVYEEDHRPTLLSPLYIASFSSFGDADFQGRALATLRSLRSSRAEVACSPVLLSAYDLKRRLKIGEQTHSGDNSRELIAELNKGCYWQLDSGVFEQDSFQDETWTGAEFISVFQAARPPWVVAFDFRPNASSIAAFEEALRKAIRGGRESLGGSITTLLMRFHGDAGLWEREKSDSETNRITGMLSVLSEVLREASACIHVVGVVENELGPGIRSRLRSLARLRRKLDDAGIEMPIHIFGASDPQALALYCLAGADMFDGVNWSRYYLDVEDCCLRDKGLLSWKEPSLGEATSIARQVEMLGVGNIFCMQRFMANLRRLAETRQPQTATEEAWMGFAGTCCEEIIERRE
jgi:hypothetical protein